MAISKKKKSNKYLNISLTDSSSELLKKYAEIWSGIKDQIKKINPGKSGEYGKDYSKIKFSSDDNLFLNKILKFRILKPFLKKMVNITHKFFWITVWMKYKC